MLQQWIFLIALLLNANRIYCDNQLDHENNSHEISDDDHYVDEHNAKVGENRLAAQLFAVLDHYKQEDPVGLPGAPIADPMPVPDMKKNLGFLSLNMRKVEAHGLSKFRIKNINVDLKAMKVDGGIQLDLMTVKGTYTMTSLFSKADGPFTIKLENVFVKASANIMVEMDGRLTTESIRMDITFAKMDTDFQNLGFLGAAFQGVVNSAPNLVFDTMKPFILKEADTKLREEINKNIKDLMGDRRLPNSITPLDMAIAEARKKVRSMGYDPYRIPNYNRTVGVFSMQMVNTWITGVSSFYRVGNMTMAMENNTLAIHFQVGTQKIHGATQWEVGFGIGLVSRVGHAQFSVEHIKVSVDISQSLDTRKRPQINDLQIDLGNIQVRMDGAGTIDYVMEFVVNVLPNVLRYQIMDAIENPIKMRIQEKFNQIDVEMAIKQNFHKFQQMNSANATSADFAFDLKL